MKHLLLSVALCVAAMSAHATCGYSGNPAIDNNCAPETPSTGPSIDQRQQAAAIAAAAARADANATSTAAGGSATASGNGGSSSSSSTVQGSGNATVTNNITTGGGSGTAARAGLAAISLPAAAPAIAPTIGGGVVTTVVLGCGPLVRLLREPIIAVETGFFSRTERITGYNYFIAEYLDENGNVAVYKRIGDRLFGHEVIREGTVVGVSQGASLQLGGGAAGGAGSIGGGVSGGVTSQTGIFHVRLCDPFPEPRERRVEAPVPAPVAVLPPPARPSPRKRVPPRPQPVAAVDECVKNASQMCQRKPQTINLR